MNFYSV